VACLHVPTVPLTISTGLTVRGLLLLTKRDENITQGSRQHSKVKGGGSRELDGWEQGARGSSKLRLVK
jgi:hypothetical protein